MFAFATTLSLGACASNQDSVDSNEVDDNVDAKADGFTPMRMGTYDVAFSDYYALTLHEDGTFHLQGGCKPNPNGPSCFAITTMDGNYRFTRSTTTGSHYIRLTNNLDDSLAFRFRYVVTGSQSETVALTDMHDSNKSTATLENADKQQEGESCGGFTAHPGECATGLECVNTQGCCDLPGTCELPASTN